MSEINSNLPGTHQNFLANGLPAINSSAVKTTQQKAASANEVLNMYTDTSGVSTSEKSKPCTIPQISFSGLQTVGPTVSANCQSTSIRVVAPSGSISQYVKHTDNFTSSRGHTTPTCATARANTSTHLTVTRSTNQTLYPLRQNCPIMQISGTSIGSAPRSSALVRTTSSIMPTALSLPPSLMRGGTLLRNSSNLQNITSSGNSSAPFGNQVSGQVQIRAMTHQPIQRVLSATATPRNSQPVNLSSENSAIQNVLSSQTVFSNIASARQTTMTYSLQHASQNQQISPTTTTAHRSTLSLQGPTEALSASLSCTRQVKSISINKPPLSKLSGSSTTSKTSAITQIPSTFINNVAQSVSPTFTVAARSSANLAVSLSGTNNVVPTSRVLQVHPMVFTTPTGGKMGCRPPIAISPKIQHSLTITQLGTIGKPQVAGNSSASLDPQNVSGGLLPFSNSVASTNVTPAIIAPTSSQLMSVSQSAAIFPTGRDTTSSCAAVIPLAIIPKGTAPTTLIGGSVTAVKNSAQTVDNCRIRSTAPANFFIQHRNMAGSTIKNATIPVGVSNLTRGSTILCDNVPTVSLQACSNILSLSNTTPSVSVGAQGQIINPGGTLSISTLPFATHTVSASSYTVIPSVANRNSAITQHVLSSVSIGQQDAIPVRLNSVMPTDAASSMQYIQDKNAQILYAATSLTSSLASSLTSNPNIITRSFVSTPKPLVNVTSQLASTYTRGCQIEVSSKRAAKNLAPALLSMSSARTKITRNENTLPTTQNSVPYSSELDSVISTVCSNQEYQADDIPGISHLICGSPALSDGSTTVSANSSPDITQQTQYLELCGQHSIEHRGSLPFSAANELCTDLKKRNSCLILQDSADDGKSFSCNTNNIETGEPGALPHLQQFKGLLMPAFKPSVNKRSESNNFLGENSHHDISSLPSVSVTGNKENAEPFETTQRMPSSLSILQSYQPTYKLALNHFQRYSDIKARDDGRTSITELSKQKDILATLNGWKIYHLQQQMVNLVEGELEELKRLEIVLTKFENDNLTEVTNICELLKGNIQRSKFLVDGINEAQCQLLKVFEHKTHVSHIIQRCASRRVFQRRGTN